MALSSFEKAVTKATGDDIKLIREIPIDVRRNKLERKFGKKLNLLSFFPLIGRGSPLQGLALTHEEVEKELEKAFKNEKET